jgi:hypothetical protein
MSRRLTQPLYDFPCRMLPPTQNKPFIHQRRNEHRHWVRRLLHDDINALAVCSGPYVRRTEATSAAHGRDGANKTGMIGATDESGFRNLMLVGRPPSLRESALRSIGCSFGLHKPNKFLSKVSLDGTRVSWVRFGYNMNQTVPRRSVNERVW